MFVLSTSIGSASRGKRFIKIDDLWRNCIGRDERALQLIELRAFGKTLVPEKKYDFFKSRMRCQIVDVVSLIDQLAFVADDVGD